MTGAMAEERGGHQAPPVRQQFLTFSLGGEHFAVDVMSVEEIRSDAAMTPIPRTPPFLRGVMNLRGAIVPVVDLRERFRFTPRARGPAEVVVILQVGPEAGGRTVGALVDEVSDVVELPVESLSGSPDFGSAIDTRFIRGIATLDEQIIVLLDVDRLFSLEELSRMDELSAESKEIGDGGERQG